MKNEATLLTVEGEVKTITPLNGKDFKLDELQKAVEGLIDIVYFPNDDDLIMICNDEGRFDKKYNSNASLYLSIHFGTPCEIYGNVVVCKDAMVK